MQAGRGRHIRREIQLNSTRVHAYVYTAACNNDNNNVYINTRVYVLYMYALCDVDEPIWYNRLARSVDGVCVCVLRP